MKPRSGAKKLAAITNEGKVMTTRKSGSQGDHVTAYGLIDRAIKNCINKISKGNISKGREDLLRIAQGVASISDSGMSIDEISETFYDLINKYEQGRVSSAVVDVIATCPELFSKSVYELASEAIRAHGKKVLTQKLLKIMQLMLI